MLKCNRCGKRSFTFDYPETGNALLYPSFQIGLSWKFPKNPFGGQREDEDWERTEDHDYVTCQKCFEKFLQFMDNYYGGSEE